MHVAYHTSTSLIDLININIVDDVVLDYMHLVLLGVTRKLLLIWTKEAGS